MFNLLGKLIKIIAFAATMNHENDRRKFALAEL